MTGWENLGTGGRAGIAAAGAAVVALLLGGLWYARQAEVPATVPSTTKEAMVEGGTTAAKAPAAAAPATAPAAPQTAPSKASAPAADSAAAPSATHTRQTASAPASATASATDTAPAASKAATDQTGAAEKAAAPGKAEGQKTAEAKAAEKQAAADVANAPSFDVVRVSPDGQALVAGRAAAGAKVTITLDGKDVATAPADPQGRFVAIFSMPVSDRARVLRLEAPGADGKQLASADDVIVAPTPDVVPPGLSPADAAAPGSVGAAAANPPATGNAPNQPSAGGTGTAPGATASANSAPSQTNAPDQPSAPAVQTGPQAPAVLLAGKTGVRVLQPGGDASAAHKGEVTIDAISYGERGEVQLSGHGAAGESVRLYIDNVAVATVRVGDDSAWQVNLTDLAPGLYTLRADQIGVGNKVTSRFETPFKREAPSVVAAAAKAAEEAAAAAAAKADAKNNAGGDSASKAGDGTAPASTAPAATASTAPAAGGTAPAAGTAPATGTAAAPAASGDSAVATAGAPASPAPADQNATASTANAPSKAPGSTAGVRAAIITVQPGYTLWGIARKSYGDGFLYVKVFEANRSQIRNPDLIYPGQIFSVPAVK